MKYTLLGNDVTDKLLVELPIRITDGSSDVAIDMSLANQISEAYRIAQTQRYIYETYHDFGYTYEETARLAEHVISTMDDCHMSESEAIEYILFEDEPAFMDDDNCGATTYALRGHGSGDEDAPSAHITEERQKLFGLDEISGFNPFIYEVDGVKQTLTYKDAVIRYGAKKVDAFVKDIISTNAKYEGVFEEIMERLVCFSGVIDNMTVYSAYTDGIDYEESVINIRITFVKENGESVLMNLKGYFVEGLPILEMDDGSSFFDYMDSSSPGLSDYIRDGKVMSACTKYKVLIATAKAHECGLRGIIIPGHEIRRGADEGVYEYVNSLACCGKVFAVHSNCDTPGDEISHIGPLQMINVNVYGYLIGSVNINTSGYWHVDVTPEMFIPLDMSFDDLKGQVILEGKNYE